MTTRARTRRRVAGLLVVGLGGARLVQGIAEVVAPRRFLKALGTPETPAQVHLGFRMKGGARAAGLIPVLVLLWWSSARCCDRCSLTSVAFQ